MENIEFYIRKILNDSYLTDSTNNHVDSFYRTKEEVQDFLLSKNIIENNNISLTHKYSYTKNNSYIESDLVNLPYKRPDLIEKGYKEYFQTFYKLDNITIIISELYSYNNPLYFEIRVEPENRIDYYKLEFLPSGLYPLL